MVTADDAERIATERAAELRYGMPRPLRVETRRGWSGQVMHYVVASNRR